MDVPTLPVVYDAGALIAAEAGDRFMMALHRTALHERRVILVPSPVLTQVWRGGARQARLALVLRGCIVDAPDEQIAKRAGVLLGQTRTSDAVDAIVVATASVVCGSIVTSDPGDLRSLATAADRRHPPPLIEL